jgi:hypothetical protein
VRDGTEEYQLYNVSAVARQSDGDLVVADGGSRTVRLYGSTGVFKKLLGKAGSGPGEFRDPRQVLIHAEDSISVWDDSWYRVTRFDSEGNFSGVHTFARDRVAKFATPPLYPGVGRLMASGDLLVRLIEKSKASAVEGWSRKESGALLVSAQFASVDTLMFFAGAEQVLVESPWGPLAVAPALGRQTLITVQPNDGRACIGEQERAEVHCFGEGGVRSAVRWQDQSRPLRGDEGEIIEWRERTLEIYEQKLSRDDARRFVAQIPLPAERPPYTGLVLDAGGNLWVRLGPAGRGEAEMDEHFVFDPGGRLLGSVMTPGVRILEIGEDYLIGVYLDEVDVQSIRVYDLAKPAPASGGKPMDSTSST